MKIDHVLGIIGWPVKHSLSPHMQNQALQHCGLNSWFYLPMPVDPANISAAIMGLRALSFRGVNVTVPHKEAVLPFMNHLSDAARAIGAVNTIVIEEDGTMIGDNTDADGFMNDLKDHGIEVKDLSALILGAGGSAKAVAYGLLKHGCSKLSILNRSPHAAEALKNNLSARFIKAHIDSGPLEPLKDKASVDLIINCTSFGLNENEDKFPFMIDFNNKQIVYDLIYEPKKTALLRKAQADGALAINGLGMLLHQGALSFSLWTNLDAPLAVMKAALKV